MVHSAALRRRKRRRWSLERSCTGSAGGRDNWLTASSCSCSSILGGGMIEPVRTTSSLVGGRRAETERQLSLITMVQISSPRRAHVGWLIYDLILHPLLGRNDMLFAASPSPLVGLAFVPARSSASGGLHPYGACWHLMVPRLDAHPPAQRRLSPSQGGKTPDDRLAAQANSAPANLSCRPVVFTMISNHYPRHLWQRLNWSSSRCDPAGWGADCLSEGLSRDTGRGECGFLGPARRNAGRVSPPPTAAGSTTS